jgi:hypothetical protein
MNAFLDAAGANADALLSSLRNIRAQVSAGTGHGNIVVSGVATQTRHTLQMIDPDTGRDKEVDVAWRDALQLQIRLERPRPFGYVLAGSETQAARHLRGLGVTVLRIAAEERVASRRARRPRRKTSAATTRMRRLR